jgi:hypothetical protein
MGKAFSRRRTTINGISYVGKAAPGSAEASFVWQVTRRDRTGAIASATEHADGDGSFDNDWTNHPTHPYS